MFWKERWCGDLPSNLAFPSLSIIARDKEVWVGNVWSIVQGRGYWSSTFFRQINDWELEDVERLLFRLRDKKVIEGIEDIVRWAGTKMGRFLLSLCTRSWNKSSSSLFLGSAFGKTMCNRRCVSLHGKQLGGRF